MSRSDAITDAMWSVVLFLVVIAARLMPKRHSYNSVRAAFDLGRKVERQRNRRRAANIDDVTVQL